MKKFMSLMLAVTMMVGLVACSSDSDGDSAQGGTPEEEKLHIGYVVKSLADQHWIMVRAGAEAKAEELGVELTFLAPKAETDIEQQVNMILDLIAQDVDAICLAPSQPDAVLAALQQAEDAGIPILFVDTAANFEPAVSFIGTGNESAGYIGGTYAAELFGEGAKAVVLRGNKGDATHDQREAGIVKGLEDGKVEILEVQDAQSKTELGMSVMEDLIQRHDDIDVVVTTNDLMAQGAQKAIEQSGKDIKVLGFDGTEPVITETITGKFLGTVAQNPYAMGELGVENAVKAAKGEEVDARIDTGAVLVTAENAEEYLADLAEKTK